MHSKKIIAVLLVTAVVVGLFQIVVSGAPTLAGVTDTVLETEVGEALLFSDDSVEIDIGEKQAETNVRYVEINGVQTEIADNGNKYLVDIGDENVLVEITEKTHAGASSVVKTQYFYIDVAGKTCTKLDMDTYMQSYEEKAVRTVGEKGIRFKAHALTEAKKEINQYIIEEYGYIITTEQLLGNAELTLDSPKYVRGVGYNRADGVDVVFDATNDNYDVFTVVLKNIPVRNYKTNVVCKTYTRLVVHGRPYVVYGEEMRGNVYDIASGNFAKDYTNTDVAGMIYDYVSYNGVNTASFSNAEIDTVFGTDSATVSGSFTNTDSVGKTYNVYVRTYDKFGVVTSVRKSEDFTVASGENAFSASFALESDEQQTEAIVLTSDMVPVCLDNVIVWAPTDKNFYSKLASNSHKSDTDFSDYFNPDINVSYIEGLALVSNLHAKYNNKEVSVRDDVTYEYTVEMDDPELLVDLSERNSVNLTGINFGHATGYIDEENGYLVGTSSRKSNGGFDPQVTIKGLSLDARKYNVITIRMKLETIPGGSASFVGQTVQIFFMTKFSSSASEDKSIKYVLKSSDIAKGWFELEFDMGDSKYWTVKNPTSSYPEVTGKLWKDLITGVRIDPIGNNGKFYIDYVKFSQSDKYFNENWYDIYLDYGIENGFIDIGKVATDEYDRDINREEFLLMLMNAYDEEAFPAINEINGIPDIGKNDKNSDLYMLLYRAGITLGFDEEGNLGLDSMLKRSEFVSLANRMLVAKNRLKGTVDASWTGDDYKHDIEFDSTSDIDKFSNKTRMSNIVVSDGHLSFSAQYDSYMVRDSLSIDASKYHKLRVRLKAKFAGDAATANRGVEFFFKPEDYNGTLTDYHMSKDITDFYIDTMGWYVFDIELSSHPKWKGMVNYFRFDTMNSPGDYVIDYIRFIKDPYSDLPTQQDLINAGYTSKKLMPDGFENGFYVSRVDQSMSAAELQAQNRAFTFPGSTGAPVWTIGPWWQGANASERYDLYENRDTTTGVYTLADKKGINKIVYNPIEKSITQTLNCSLIYNGNPHVEKDYEWWPHQLLDTNANFVNTVTQESHSADADRMFIELDIRLLNFEDKDTANVSTTEHPYRKVCDYLAYFYLRPKKDPGQRIWFGLNLFSGRSLAAPTNITPGWSPDSAAHMYMYGMKQATVYGGIENSLNPSKGEVVLNEWKHIRLDVTPHVDRAIEWANRDNIFGFEVTREEMFWNGVNIGFESAGNYDCTIEIKNFNLVAYYAPEENN